MPNFICIACASPLYLHIDGIVDDRYGHNLRCSVWNCTECGYMGTFPRLSNADLSGLYSNYYPRKDIKPDDVYKSAKGQLGWFRFLLRWLNGTNNMGHYLANKDNIVLDIGVGDCSSILEMKLSGVENSYGIDPDENIRRIALQYGLNVQIGIFDQHSFEGIRFDLICLNQVLEHVPDTHYFLKVLRSRLSSDGKIFICVPNVNSIYRKLFKRTWINWHVPFHQHHFSDASLSLLFQKSGFRVLRKKTITPNLWTQIQVRNSAIANIFGGQNYSWENSDRIGRDCILVRPMKRFLSILVGSLLIIQNRSIDCLFMGDSLTYEIKKNTDFDSD